VRACVCVCVCVGAYVPEVGKTFPLEGKLCSKYDKGLLKNYHNMNSSDCLENSACIGSHNQKPTARTPHFSVLVHYELMTMDVVVQ
jgi:hypothetical protein